MLDVTSEIPTVTRPDDMVRALHQEIQAAGDQITGLFMGVPMLRYDSTHFEPELHQEGFFTVDKSFL